MLLQKQHHIALYIPDPKGKLDQKNSSRDQKIVDITNQTLVERTPLLIGVFRRPDKSGVRDALFLDLERFFPVPTLPCRYTIACFKKKTKSSRHEKPCPSFPVIAINAVSLRRASSFARADACCRVILNTVFFYSSLALFAEMSPFIIYAGNAMRNVSHWGLLS